MLPLNCTIFQDKIFAIMKAAEKVTNTLRGKPGSGRNRTASNHSLYSITAMRYKQCAYVNGYYYVGFLDIVTSTETRGPTY